jgi:hypothetical protein
MDPTPRCPTTIVIGEICGSSSTRRAPRWTTRECAEQAGKRFDGVYCSNMPAHCYRHELVAVLTGLLNLLTPDGFAEIRVPDLQAIFTAAVDRGLDLDDVLEVSPDEPITLLDAIYGRDVETAGRGGARTAYKTGFSAASLQDALYSAGFDEVHALSRVHPNELRMVGFRRAATLAQRGLLGIESPPDTVA